MKSPRLPLAALLALALPASGRRLHAEDALPKAPPAVRYEAMAVRSPFTAPTVALPTATPAPVPAGPHWWDQLSVTSLMELGGNYFVAVIDKANGKHYVLERNKADEDSHLLLTEVQWNERGDQSTVIVRKNNEVSPPLRFDPSATASSPTGIAQPFNPSVRPAGLPNPPLPPGFSGTPPPPPPGSTSVVRRSGPITSRPPGQNNSATVTSPGPPNVAPVRRVRPLGGDSRSDD